MRLLLIAVLMTLAGSLVSADRPAGPKPGSLVVSDWKKDPACRLVFFAVLQGLYEDGVSDAVANNIVPPGKKGREQMRHSFVLDCPLCQPAYEAFRVYQARPRFASEDGPAVLGKGLSADETRGLMSEAVAARLITLRGPIKRWVERRLASMKFDGAGRKKWWKEVSARAGRGTATLRGLIAKDPSYRGWSGYWGCAACLGSQDACRALREAPVPRPEE